MVQIFLKKIEMVVFCLKIFKLELVIGRVFYLFQMIRSFIFCMGLVQVEYVCKKFVRDIDIHGNPESFYFRIYNESGIIGILAFFSLLIFFYGKMFYLRKIKEFQFDLTIITLIIFLLLIQAIANEPFYSNGVTQIFTFFILFNYAPVKNNT